MIGLVFMNPFPNGDLDPEIVEAIEQLDPALQERFLVLLEKASEYAELRDETVQQPFFAPFPPSIVEH